jgi:hypothetical protein
MEVFCEEWANINTLRGWEQVIWIDLENLSVRVVR